jgi:hypothetical protein
MGGDRVRWGSGGRWIEITEVRANSDESFDSCSSLVDAAGETARETERATSGAAE